MKGAQRNDDVVLILLRYYTYAHIHAHRDIEGKCVCVYVTRTYTCFAYRSFASTRDTLASANIILLFAACVHVSRTRMYVYV